MSGNAEMVKIGVLRRGLRGRYSYETALNPGTDWFYRDSEDEPALVELFARKPAEVDL